ncbi:MAG: aldose 1-epimerase family protein [Planctomycetaceae bacterium]
MAQKTWKLIDQRLGIGSAYNDVLTIGKRDLEELGDASIVVSQYQAGLSEGVTAVRVKTGKMEFVILPTRGMSIWKANLIGDEEVNSIGWQSPVRGPVHPKFVNVYEPSGLGWLDGFDELFVRCGLQSNGAPEFDEETGRLKYPLHGLVGNRPAHEVTLKVDTEAKTIQVIGVVEETRFHFIKLRMVSTITAKIGGTSIHVEDEVTNFSTNPAEVQMLYHINFGAPLLDAGSQCVAPVKKLVPRNAHAATGVAQWNSYQPPTEGFEEQVYFFEMVGDANNQTQTLLKNAHGRRGVSLKYSTDQLPCFSLWKNTAPLSDGYVTGLEPGTNFPNPRSFEGKKGRVVKLAGGAKTTFAVEMEIHGSAEEVAAAEAAIAKLQAGHKPEVFDAPQPDWCA